MIFFIALKTNSSFFPYEKKIDIVSPHKEKDIAKENSASSSVSSTTKKNSFKEEDLKNLDDDFKKDNSINEYIPSKIVFITLESTRWDHLSYMGYPRDTTPFLKKLADEGILFKNMHNSIPLTSPSHASMFTALYPRQHKVNINNIPLDDQFLTLAEYFKSLRYSTAGFTSASSLLTANLGQGFDLYETVKEATFFHEDKKRDVHRKAEDTMKLVYKWLETKRRGDQFFLWIHLNDTHRRMREVAKDYEVSQNDTIKTKLGMLNYWSEVEKINFDFTPLPKNINRSEKVEDNAWNGMNRYDGAIQTLDEEISKLYDYFNENDYNGETLWIVLPDHGEGMGEHNFGGHGENLYEELLRTPMIMSGYSFPPKIVDEKVENIDIFPTIAEIMEINIKQTNSRVFGKSLMPLLSGAEGKEYLYAMTPIFHQFSIQDNKFKLIMTDKQDSEEIVRQRNSLLFNLKNDPYEQNEISEQFPNIVNKYMDLILEKSLSMSKP